MQIITTTAQDYIHIFSQYITQMLSWGQWLFFSLLTINITIMCLWYAFDSESINASAAKFIRHFFIVTVFYTIMINHAWLSQVLASALAMGKSVTGMSNVDPSSVIENGFSIANNLIHPVMSFNIFKISTAVIVMFACYFVVITCFISIALNLAVTLIMCQLLISVSTFFLGFAALESTRQIARNTLDVLLASCVKLLALYLVVGAGSSVISNIESQIPSLMSQNNFDAYWWLVASVLLFWLLSKNIPDQMARLVSSALSETRGHDVAAIALALNQYAATTASHAANAVSAGSKVAGVSAQAIGAMGLSAISHYKEGAGITGAAAGVVSDFAKSTAGAVTDHLRHLSDKATGGEGTHKSASDIPGVGKRMNEMAKERLQK